MSGVSYVIRDLIKCYNKAQRNKSHHYLWMRSQDLNIGTAGSKVGGLSIDFMARG